MHSASYRNFEYNAAAANADSQQHSMTNMMANFQQPVIVGAGPTGKGAALWLARAGIATRLVDAAIEPAQQSKALAVNPRSLELLEPTGVTEKMLAIGRPIRGARAQIGWNVIAQVQFEGLEHRFPFMLALSQATTEQLLGQAIEDAGGKVEHGVALVNCRNTPDGVEAELKHAANGAIETIKAPWLLAADGAHSAARHALQVPFPGSSFPAPWYLADMPLDTALASDFAHAFFLDAGAFLFLIPVVDESSRLNAGPPIWRLISNRPNPAELLVDAMPAGPPVWESDFHVAHRIVDHLQVGNVYFAGDAAHLHSPVGARGLNLGLEDAWVFAHLAASGQLNRYESLRMAIDRRVVKRVELFSRMVITKSALVRLLRMVMFRWGFHVPIVRRQFLKTVTGLDHAVEMPS
jgi:2-polyprenyl-6-methoxyphenol hydroxylase-like FAD-dependent oxidoreductase